MRFLLALLFAAAWIPGTLSGLSPPDDQDASGDDLEISGSGSGDDDLVGFVLSSTPSLDTTRVSTTTERNQVLMHSPERAVTSQASPTTAAGAAVTAHRTAGAPAEGGVVTEHRPHGQTTSASPDVHEEHSTSRPTKAQPRAGVGILKTAATPSHSTTIPTTTVVMHVNTTAVMLKLPVVPESEHTPTKKTQLAPTPVAPSQDEIIGITRDVPTADSLATTPTLLLTVPEEPIIKGGRFLDVASEPERDTDIVIEDDLTQQQFQETAGQSQSLLDRKEVLAGVISGGVVGLAFAVLLVSLMVYRMKKKDEGSYSLDEHNHPNVGYQRPQAQEEFLA